MINILSFAPIVFELETDTAQNLLPVDVLEPCLLNIIRYRDMLEARSASNTKTNLLGTIHLQLGIPELLTPVRFGSGDKLAVPVLLERPSLAEL